MNPGSETLAITLRRESSNQPWGFRLQGGTDFTTPLSVQSVNNGSVSEACGLLPGDAVLSINDRSSDELEHEEAKKCILMCGNEVNLVIQRGAVKIWRPKVTPMSELRPSEVSHPDGQSADGQDYVQKTSLAAEKQDVMHIGSSHNRSARPFPGFGGGATQQPAQQAYPQQQQPYQQQQPPHQQQQQAYQQQQQQQPYQQPQQQYGGQQGYDGGAGEGQGVVNAQYNTPIDMYSQDNVADTYSQQSQALTGNMDNYNPYGQQGGGTRSVGTRSVAAPVSKPPSERKDSQYMKCKVCGSLCVGVFVKIKGEPMHPECFKCARCSMSLKQQGYITVEDKLYCENCAKQVAAPPGQNMQATAVYR